MSELAREAMRYACQRIEDFYAVQKGGDMNTMVEAVNTMRQSYGLTDEIATEFTEWATDFCGDEHIGALLLGLLVGIIMMENGPQG